MMQKLTAILAASFIDFRWHIRKYKYESVNIYSSVNFTNIEEEVSHSQKILLQFYVYSWVPL